MWNVELGVLFGTVALGFVHGVEPGHGWPVAASYALDQTNKWLYGFAASFVLGVGHLISSVVMVFIFFWAKEYFDLAQVNDPLAVGGVQIGGPVSVVAGVLLILLGVREYLHGHSHSPGSGYSHDHHELGDHNHGHHGHEHHDYGDEHHADSHDHGHSNDNHGHDHHHHGGGLLGEVKRALPFGGHSHGSMEDATDRGLWGIAGFAFVLGFAHEEEFEIIAICSTTNHCLELMFVYALTVIVGIVGLTLLLIAGYERYEERAERYAEHLPLFSAAVLVLMGVGFVVGLF
jgi:nickel/cobalt transporter (NicO) family protein